MKSVKGPFSVVELSAFDLARGITAALPPLEKCAAWRIPQAITAKQAADWTRRVEAAKDLWSNPFLDLVTLGEAWYMHFEAESSAQYFDLARKYHDRINTILPSCQHLMNDLMARAVRTQHVHTRPFWFGAGAHIFERQSYTFKNGGAIHFDTEGLREEQIRAKVPAVSCVLMLQSSEQGGALRLWDHRYTTKGREETFDDLVFKKAPDAAYADVEYEAGDFVIFDSYRLHCIQKSKGKRSRISLTTHAVRTSSNSWESWF